MNTRYLYKQDVQQYLDAENYQSTNDPVLISVKKGIILPALEDRHLPWGLGGVLKSDGSIVRESQLDDTFGGPYEFAKQNVKSYDSTVLFLGVFPNHWGHFLIDVLCKLWCIDELSEDTKIAYIGLDWKKTKELNETYYSALELLGITKDRLLYVDSPSQFEEILIPERTLGFKHNWNSKYLLVVERMLQNANRIALSKGQVAYDKIYFSRMEFGAAKKKEIGEKQLSDLFEMNGYKVICPEKLPVADQLFMFNNCKEYVCVSGTLAHNTVFANKKAKVVVLNRTWAANPPQMRIDQMTGLNVTYIDAFVKGELKRGTGYRARDNRIVHFLSVNENVEQYAEDNGLIIPHKKMTTEMANHIKYVFLCFRQLLAIAKHKVMGGF